MRERDLLSTKIDNGKCKKSSLVDGGNKFEMIFLIQCRSFVSSNSLISHRHCSIFQYILQREHSLISSNAFCNFRQLLNNNEEIFAPSSTSLPLNQLITIIGTSCAASTLPCRWFDGDLLKVFN